MGDESRRPARGTGAAAGAAPQELPPPPRLVQYGRPPPARQAPSREAGAGAAPVPLVLREDRRLEMERRQQLAHSIQLLQQRAARQQQQARLGSSVAAVPGQPQPPTAAVPAQATTPLRQAGHKSPTATATGSVKGDIVAASTTGQAVKVIQSPSANQETSTAAAANGVHRLHPPAAAEPAGPATDGHPPAAAVGASAATAPALPTDKLRNGANGAGGGGAGDTSKGGQPAASPAESAECAAAATEGTPTKRAASAEKTEGETEPAAKRARSDVGADGATARGETGTTGTPMDASDAVSVEPVPVAAAASAADDAVATEYGPAAPAAPNAAVKAPSASSTEAASHPAAADVTSASALVTGSAVPAATTPAAAAAAPGPPDTTAADGLELKSVVDAIVRLPAPDLSPVAPAPATASSSEPAPAPDTATAEASATSVITAPAAAAIAATTHAAAASPTHKGKKSWLSRLANSEGPTSDPASPSDGGAGSQERSASDAQTAAVAAAGETDSGSRDEKEGPMPAEKDKTASAQAPMDEDRLKPVSSAPDKTDSSGPTQKDSTTKAQKESTAKAQTSDAARVQSTEDKSPADTDGSSTEMDTAAQGGSESSPGEGSSPTDGSKPEGDETSPEGEEQDGASPGETEESAVNGTNGTEGVLGPRAAAAATKAAAAVKKKPGRPPKKRPAESPADGAPKKPSVMALKKSGEKFTQTNFCCQIAYKLPRCRECRAVPTVRHNKPSGIYCRFTAFRKVRYTRTGQLTVTGFCDPFTDSGGESDRLWRANPAEPPATMDPETAKFLLAHVGNQFCDLVCEEEAARRCHMGEDETVAWKRVVQGCREMCDVCETTLFNVHWVCSRCGFAVCVDCYRSRKDGAAKNYGEELADRDQFRWLLCGTKPHQQDKLVMTQIVAGDALQMLNRQVHEARRVAGLPLSCDCEVAKRLQQETGKTEDSAAAAGDGVVKTEPGTEAVKTEDVKPPAPASSVLSSFADVLSKIASDGSDSDDSDDSGAGGSSGLALRRLLVPGSQAETKPKPAKERQERPKRSGWSMGDSLDEVLDKVSARVGGGATPAGHASSGPAAALQHFVRRGTSKRGFRERLPIRIMTLGESTRLYPNVRHSWLCDGKLLRLHESDAPDSVRLFRDQWKRGQPVLCSRIGGALDRALWSVEAFIRDFGDVRNDLINCRTGNIVPNQPMRRFWEGFESVTRRLRDDKGQPMILKLKDWPPGEDFADMMPRRFNDLMSVLPMTDYTRRNGRLNLASCLPDIFVRPDLGPKMYIAYGCALHPSKASTNLHLDVSDAVNIMVHVGIPPDGDADNAEALRAIDEAGCDQLTKRRVRDEMPGALWHIYHAADADKIRDLLNKVAIERGDQLEPHHDPIHDQSWYLDGPLRRRLYEEYRVEGYPIVQCAGDAVFIPAGAPHQVRNLHSCIKVAEDFVSPENIGHCFDLTQEFRSLSDTHTNHEDKLQIKNIIYHAMKDAVSCLLGASAGGAGASSSGTGAAAETGAAATPDASSGDVKVKSEADAAAKVKSEPGV